jgi:hypothetical protein
MADICIPIHINMAAAANPNVFTLFFIFSPLVLSLKIFDPEEKHPAQVVKLKAKPPNFGNISPQPCLPRGGHALLSTEPD